jgi:hypothetical protein
VILLPVRIAIVFQDATHVTDIVEQVRDDKMIIVGGFDALAHHSSPQDIPTDESDKDRMLEVMGGIRRAAGPPSRSAMS